MKLDHLSIYGGHNTGGVVVQLSKVNCGEIRQFRHSVYIAAATTITTVHVRGYVHIAYCVTEMPEMIIFFACVSPQS